MYVLSVRTPWQPFVYPYIDIHYIFEHYCGEMSSWFCTKKHSRWQWRVDLPMWLWWWEYAVDRLNTLFFNLKILPCPPTYCQCQRVDNSTLCIARYHHMNEELQCHPERTGIWKLCFYIICMCMTKEIWMCEWTEMQLHIHKHTHVQAWHTERVMLFNAGYLCGACKHDHDGVGVLTPLCQRCENYYIFFLVVLSEC